MRRTRRVFGVHGWRKLDISWNYPVLKPRRIRPTEATVILTVGLSVDITTAGERCLGVFDRISLTALLIVRSAEYTPLATVTGAVGGSYGIPVGVKAVSRR